MKYEDTQSLCCTLIEQLALLIVLQNVGNHLPWNTSNMNINNEKTFQREICVVNHVSIGMLYSISRFNLNPPLPVMVLGNYNRHCWQLDVISWCHLKNHHPHM